MPSSTPTDVPEQRILEQALRLPAAEPVRVPVRGMVTGWAACRMLRATFFDGLDLDGHTQLPVPLAVGPAGKLRRDGRVITTHDRLDEAEVLVIHSIRSARAERATFDAMRLAADEREATVVIDMMAAAGALRRAESVRTPPPVRLCREAAGWLLPWLSPVNTLGRPTRPGPD